MAGLSGTLCKRRDLSVRDRGIVDRKDHVHDCKREALEGAGGARGANAG